MAGATGPAGAAQMRIPKRICVFQLRILVALFESAREVRKNARLEITLWTMRTENLRVFHARELLDDFCRAKLWRIGDGSIQLWSRLCLRTVCAHKRHVSADVAFSISICVTA